MDKRHIFSLLIGVPPILFTAVAVMSLVASCVGNKQDMGIDYLAVTDSVEVKVVPIDAELLMVDRIFVADGNLIAYQAKAERLFTVFPLPFDGGSYAVGYKGKGPDEFVRPDARSFVPCEGGFQVADGGDMTIKKVLVSPRTLKVVDKSKVKSVEPYNGMFEMTDGYVNLNIFSDEYEYVSYDKNTGDRKEICPYPKWERNNTDISNAFYYNKFVTPHPSGKKLAAFYGYFRKVRIVDECGKILVEKTLDFEGDAGTQSPGTADTYFAFESYPVATEEYIAVAYSDRVAGKGRGSITEVQIWDWDCTLLHRLILDRRFVDFAIDFETETLFAIPFNDPHHLYLADLSPVL